jgi:hypothetical protein
MVYVHRVSDLNLGPETDCPEWDILWFYHSQSNCQDGTSAWATTDYFHNLEIALFTNHPIVWHCIIIAIAGAIKQTMQNVEGQFSQ